MITYKQLLSKTILLALATTLYTPTINAIADFIIFSYDRPMQLYALLESTEHYLTGIDSTTIICRIIEQTVYRSIHNCAQPLPSRTLFIPKQQSACRFQTFSHASIQCKHESLCNLCTR